MRILAIETSCDDTGVAILEIGGRLTSPDFKVLSNIVSSQTIHQNYGGVFPMMAKREHQRNLVPVLELALKLAKLRNSKSEIRNPKQIPNSKFKTISSILERESELLKQLIPFLSKYEKPDVDFIAVTNGPGLEPCLWVGVNFARALSYYWNIPLVPVNHIEAHIAINFLSKINGNPKFETLNPKWFDKTHHPEPAEGQIQNAKSQISKQLFSAIALVVSGGHTQLILMKGVGKYKIIGETRDDAAGECFDKCAKLLGLGYPGGPIISKIAAEIDQNYSLIRTNKRIVLPRPMLNTKDYDFSFSGLKTAVLYETKGKKLTKQYVRQVCLEVQQAIIDVLLKKTIQAAKDFKVKTIILGGGVSANNELRSQFKLKVKSEKLKINVIFPEPKLSTDNGLMIAVAGFFHYANKKRWQSLKANANLRVGG